MQVPTTPMARIVLKVFKALVLVATIVMIPQVEPFVIKSLKSLPLTSVVAQMSGVAPSVQAALMTPVAH